MTARRWITVLPVILAVLVIGAVAVGVGLSSDDRPASSAGPAPASTPAPGEATPETEWMRVLHDLDAAANSGEGRVAIRLDSTSGPLRFDPATGEYNQMVLRFTGAKLRAEEEAAMGIRRDAGSVEATALRAPDVIFADESAAGSLPFGARKLTVTVAGGDTSSLLTGIRARAELVDAVSQGDGIPYLLRIQDAEGRGLYVVSGVPAFGGKYRFGTGWASESVTAATGLGGGVGSLLPKEPG